MTKFHDIKESRIDKITKHSVKGLIHWPLFGSVGYSCGDGITHSSPLKITFLGNTHPSLNVNISGSL